METLKPINLEPKEPVLLETKIGRLVAQACYSENFQPKYENTEEVIEAVRELSRIEPVSSPESIDKLQDQLTDIAEARDLRPIIITGNCAEPVDLLNQSVNQLVNSSVKSLAIVEQSKLNGALHIRRERGQNTKPRSQETQLLSDNEQVMSYMGDSVNGEGLDDRRPNPARLIAAGVQARDMELGLRDTLGVHVPAAHEALNLLYESAFMQTDSVTGRQYLLSTDLPWIGVRTNKPTGDHVKILAGINNPVGVKLNHLTSPEHIAGLQETLNPDSVNGKLVLMLRLGLDNVQFMPGLLESIKTHASGSIILYDIHGATKKIEDGQKTRVVDDIVKEVKILAAACKIQDLKLHGLHLETITEDDRIECVDSSTQQPTHPGGIDPQLNPAQTKRVLDEVAECF